MIAINILYLLAILFSFLTGLAIQQGGTCTVAAINEYFNKGTANRMRSLLETSLWVFIGELVLTRLGWVEIHIPIWQISVYTMAGAVILGIGAYINGACAVGTIGRIGNGAWDFILTLVGFFCGAFFVENLSINILKPEAIDQTSNFYAPDWALALAVCLVAYRSWIFFNKRMYPYLLTVVLGILFLLLMVIDKAWSYTDLLIDLATAKHTNYYPRLILFSALIFGAILGGFVTKNKTVKNKMTLTVLSKRFLGGAAMGLATFMLPGSHDTLILIYLPLLIGNAWLGFSLMISTIVLARQIENILSKS